MALIVCALQLIMRYSWYHQLVLLLIPLFVVVHAILEGDAPRWWLAPVVIGVLATDVHGLFRHDISAPALLSMPVYVALMLWLMLSWLIAGPKLRRPGMAHGKARPAGCPE